MKELQFSALEEIEGGQTTFLIGMMCGATVLLSMSGVLAPLAAATGTGCLTGLAAIRYWKSQGIDVNTIE
jgi:hypothetical protein